MPYALVTPPAVEPISTADAKAHLRVVDSDDDTYIDSLIVAARQYAENFTRRKLITQTWDVVWDAFPEFNCAPIVPPFPRLQSVTSITYKNESGATVTWDSSLYRVDTFSEPARITPVFDGSYPSTQAVINAVTARIVVGYGDAATDVPQEIIQAMLMHIGHLYEHRESHTQGSPVTTVPMATDSLLYPYRDFRF
jgi:uncharacterized phiE125 gp8 family phage protein